MNYADAISMSIVIPTQYSIDASLHKSPSNISLHFIRESCGAAERGREWLVTSKVNTATYRVDMDNALMTGASHDISKKKCYKNYNRIRAMN